MSKRYQAAILTASYNGLKVPNAPTIGTATAGAGSASVTFTAPSNIGGGAITSYTAISSPGGLTGSSASSPVTVSGLTNGTAYTFTVVATNAYGTGPASAASNSVTPSLNYIEEVFSTYLYTGNGSTQTITNSIDLSTKGGLVWSKCRSSDLGGNGIHTLIDTVRGAGYRISSELTGAQAYNDNTVTAFSSTGFSIGNSPINNTSSETFVSWTFREQAKFFDVVTGTTDGSGNLTVSHNLGSVPGFVIVKRTDGSGVWYCYHRSLGENAYIALNTTAASANYGGAFSVSSTSFSWNMASVANSATVVYLFAHDAGGFGLSGSESVVSCGSYTGNGSATGPTITLGYEPQWVMIKKSSGGTIGAGSSDWMIFDIMRGFSDSDRNDNYLNPNLSAAENSLGNGNFVRPLSTGFQPTGSFDLTNQTGSTYIYVAIRRGPMKVPTVGTSVFNPYTATLSAGTTVNAGLTPDLLIGKYRAGADAPRWVDRLRAFAIATGAANPQLRSDTTDAEVSSTAWTYNWNNTGYIIGNALNGLNSVIYAFGRAPSVFDEVCYTGTGSLGNTLTHNLGVTPELMIVKARAGGPSSGAGNWVVYTATTGNTAALYLNDSASVYSGDINYWNNTSPTATQFTVGLYSSVNGSAETYVAYLFATCAGVSKVGSYTGTGSTQTVNCGFSGGARFVMIKRTDSTGGWYYWDTARGMVSGTDPYLLMNSNVGETNTNSIYTASTGFQIVSSAADINASGGTYIYLAIA